MNTAERARTRALLTQGISVTRLIDDLERARYGDLVLEHMRKGGKQLSVTILDHEQAIEPHEQAACNTMVSGILAQASSKEFWGKSAGDVLNLLSCNLHDELFPYPMGWSANIVSEDSLLSTALAFIALPHDGERYSGANYNPDVHMVLQFSRDAIRTRDGKQERLPRPNGISGCGIWQVGDIDDETESLRVRSADTVTLVGIQHRWFPDHDYIQATHIRYILGLVLSNYPELERSMAIVYPT